MNDLLAVSLSAFAGLALGAIFFGGLWWTVRIGIASPHPAICFLVSLILRMGIVLTGIYIIGRDDWRRLVACLIAFVVARFAVTWFTGRFDGMAKEGTHAS